jgi:predicted Kef-type K+ transport protein
VWPWEWGILDWYFDLSPLVRFLIALAVLGVCMAGWFLGFFSVWVFAIGVVMLMFSFPSQSEKSGYNF